MENASKALLIAAAVLVVIILIAVGMKIYSSTTDAQKVGINTGKTISEKTGEATDLAVSEITGNKNAINYGAKTKETIEPGDDIIIGGTEKFRVSSIEGREIKAIAFNNLKLDTNHVRQLNLDEVNEYYLNYSKFSTERYWDWKPGAYAIKMEDDRNLIQPHIYKYYTTLINMGARNIEVRIPKRDDFLPNENRYDIIQPEIASEFWLGSAWPNTSNGLDYLYYVAGSGNVDCRGKYNEKCGGVRPIIIIPK